MTDFFLVGALMGLFISLLHVVYLSKVVAIGTNSATSSVRLAALNFTLWTGGLWILMGAYVLGLWLISVVFYFVFKVIRR
jgi:hypothetical protein